MGRMLDDLNPSGQQIEIIVLTCREQLFKGIGGKYLPLRAMNTEGLARSGLNCYALPHDIRSRNPRFRH